MINNGTTQGGNMNEKLEAIHYSGEGAAIERNFSKEMIGIAKGVDFSQGEWHAAIEALQDYSFSTMGINIPQDYRLISCWLKNITAYWETDSLAHHFMSDEGGVNQEAQYEFFVKVTRLSKEEGVAVLYVAHNFWKQRDLFNPILEEIVAG